MSYIGRDIRTGAFRQLDDISSGFDGSTTGFTMQVNSGNVQLGDVNQILLSLGGVIQKPGTDFTISTSTLTFTTAPAANTSFFAILLGSDNGGTVTPTDGSVTTAKIIDDAVTGAKLADDIAITTTGDISFDGGSFVFNESSADKDFRIESNGNTHMLFVDGGNNKVGVGESANAPMGTLHVKTADSGDTAIDSNNDDLVIENDNHAGITISTPNDKAGGLYFSDPDDAASGRIVHDHSANTMVFQAGNLEFFRTDSSRKLSTGGEDLADCDAGGLTIDINANDGFSQTFKNSDVDHGVTGVAEADTFGAITKANVSNGGIGIYGFADAGTTALELQSYFETNNTSKATNANVPINLKARLRTGTSSTAPSNGGANANLFGVSDANSIRFIVDSEGDLHGDNSTSITQYDTYEDAHLVRTLALTRGEAGKGFINSKFDEFVKYNHEDLADAGLVGREDDGTPNHFINITGMQRLHNGAIWQQYEKHQRLASAFYKLAEKTIGKEEADKLLTEEEIQLLN